MAFSKRLPLVAWLAFVSLLALPVHAEPTQAEMDEARAFVKEGREQLSAKQYKRAATLLEKAFRIMHMPPEAIDLMDAYALQGKLVEAWAIGVEMQKQPAKRNEPQSFVVARKKIGEAMGALASRTPTIGLRISGAPDFAVGATIDGVPVSPEQLDKPIRVNPGTRKIRVTASYCDPFETTQETEAGAERHYDVAARLTCKPPRPVVLNNNSAASTKRKRLLAGSVAAGGFALAGVGMAIGSKISNDRAAYVASRAADCIDLVVCERLYDGYYGASTAWGISSLVALGLGVGLGTTTLLYGVLGRTSVDAPAQSRVWVQVVPTGNGLALSGTW